MMSNHSFGKIITPDKKSIGCVYKINHYIEQMFSTLGQFVDNSNKTVEIIQISRNDTNIILNGYYSPMPYTNVDKSIYTEIHFAV